MKIRIKNMLSYPKNKEPHRQPVAQNQSLLSYRRNVIHTRTATPCTAVSFGCWLNSTCTSALAKKARTVQWTKQTPKPFAILRRIAITIFMSHWLTHLLFCRAMDMENNLISMWKKYMLMEEKILIPILVTSWHNQLSYVGHISRASLSCRCGIVFRASSQLFQVHFSKVQVFYSKQSEYRSSSEFCILYQSTC